MKNSLNSRKQHKLFRIYLMLLFASQFLIGCATVPPESVVLSDKIGKDLVALQTAHTNLINQYFGSMETNVNNFVDTVYRPYVIQTTIKDLGLIDLLIEANAGRDPDGLDALDVMEIYTEEVLGQIEAFRSEMLAPVRQQKEQLNSEVNLTYNAVINANAVITAHLDSIVKVHESQSQLLSDLGLPEDSREKLIEKTVSFSDQLNSKLAQLTQLKESLNENNFGDLVDDVGTIFK